MTKLKIVTLVRIAGLDALIPRLVTSWHEYTVCFTRVQFNSELPNNTDCGQICGFYKMFIIKLKHYNLLMQNTNLTIDMYQ